MSLPVNLQFKYNFKKEEVELTILEISKNQKKLATIGSRIWLNPEDMDTTLKLSEYLQKSSSRFL